MHYVIVRFVSSTVGAMTIIICTLRLSATINHNIKLLCCMVVCTVYCMAVCANLMFKNLLIDDIIYVL